MDSAWQVIMDAIPLLLQGLGITIEVISISLVIAMFIGFIFGLMGTSLHKTVRTIAFIYVDIIRGTPLLVQIFFIYFGLPVALGLKIPAMVAGIIAISLNASAYIAEIFRAGIQSIDTGQMEAARSLGMKRGQAMWFVVLPQAVRRMIPAFVNQFIISLKDTSLLSVIGIQELTQSGEIIISTNFRAFEIWGTVGVFYFIIIYTLTRVSRVLEKRLAGR
ncbi:amino acid ABC transporter permease [Aneurinibacillus tyrosinisolvens]|uniref:amino acid ABC transporter permease n=1 Tax=Aneurinibacillus tyrosinisolvens TaxID=1443435 RepID=UPI00063FA555|nr:amino acid ABC transporter permease [Aneurinibacillus tyrosinisolvens]